MVGYNSSGPYLCGASYVGVSANFDVGIELRAFFYNSTGVNFRHFVWIDYGASLASIIANISSAEDATLPSTLQVPSAQTNFCPRDFNVDLHLVSGLDSFAEFNLVGAHKVGELVLAADMP